jgi:hypothetical protein
LRDIGRIAIGGAAVGRGRAAAGNFAAGVDPAVHVERLHITLSIMPLSGSGAGTFTPMPPRTRRHGSLPCFWRW